MPSIDTVVSWGALATAVMAIWGLATKVKQPFSQLTARVQELERQQEAMWRKLDAELVQLTKQEEINSLLLESIRALLSHEVDGNHTSQLKECVAKIDRILYEKAGTL